MSERLGLDVDRLRFIPFGVDTRFFDRSLLRGASTNGWDVVAAGMNEGKDFPTLLSALVGGERCLIVTDGPNAVEVQRAATAGDVTLERHLPILALQAHYLGARKVVIPLKDVAFSSGQTVLLENLALGRPVVVTDALPVRDYVSADVATLVPPGDPAALRKALDTDVPAYNAAVAEHVRRNFSIEGFARRLAAVCREVIEGTT
jgi:glycosyltransferase involved in cell wall biosynthesis